jgi:hypothetical protein
MKSWIKETIWRYRLNDGNEVEVSYDSDGLINWVKPLFRPAGLIFYLDPVPPEATSQQIKNCNVEHGNKYASGRFSIL